MSHRIQKVEKELQSLLSTYSLRNFKFGETLVTVSKVTVTKDLKNAKVYLSIFSPTTEVNEEDILDLFESEKSSLQSFINSSLKMKFTPKLKFFGDKTFSENFELIEKMKGLGYSPSTIIDKN